MHLAAVLWHHPALREYIPEEIEKWRPPGIPQTPMSGIQLEPGDNAHNSTHSVSILLNLMHRTASIPFVHSTSHLPGAAAAASHSYGIAANGGMRDLQPTVGSGVPGSEKPSAHDASEPEHALVRSPAHAQPSAPGAMPK